MELNQIIYKFLEPAQLKQKYLDELLSRMDLYQQAFTSKSFNKIHNYELFEFLGDSTCGVFLPWYFYRRFPQLHCPGGVAVFTKLKANYASTKSFSKIAEKFGFWPAILYVGNLEPGNVVNKKKLLEDVFEAVVGVTAFILDERFGYGVGNAIVYKILSSIFDEMDISLYYDDLVDSKTQLKELFDAYKILGTLEYDDQPKKTTIYQILGGKRTLLSENTTGANQTERQQMAAKTALNYFEKKGYTRRINEYKLFCE